MSGDPCSSDYYGTLIELLDHAPNVGFYQNRLILGVDSDFVVLVPQD